MQFIDRLREALDKRAAHQEARDVIPCKWAIENADSDCPKGSWPSRIPHSQGTGLGGLPQLSQTPTRMERTPGTGGGCKDHVPDINLSIRNGIKP